MHTFKQLFVLTVPEVKSIQSLQSIRSIHSIQSTRSIVHSGNIPPSKLINWAEETQKGSELKNRGFDANTISIKRF